MLCKKKKRNWDILLDLIPILGQAAEHYDYFGNGQSRPTDVMTKMETTYCITGK